MVESIEPLQVRQVSTPVRAPRSFLIEDEQIDVIKWLLQHRDDYADGRITKTKFWKECSQYIHTQFSKTYRHIDRAVSKWIETRKEQVEEQIAGSSIAISDTDWKQVLDEWIEFLGDLEAERQERKEAKSAEEQSAREQAQLEQERMATRMAARRRQEEQDEGDDEVSIVESSAAAEPSTATESAVSRPSSVPRKRVRARKGDDGVEAYTKAISSALGSFGSAFAKDIGSVISSSVKEPMNEMRDQMKEVKEPMNVMRDQIKEVKESQAGQQQLMLDILSEIRKLKN